MHLDKSRGKSFVGGRCAILSLQVTGVHLWEPKSAHSFTSNGREDKGDRSGQRINCLPFIFLFFLEKQNQVGNGSLLDGLKK